MKRVLYGVALIVCAFVMPWWISVLFSLIGILYFPHLYEVIFVGLIIDMLYGGTIVVHGVTIMFTIALTISLYVLTNLKRRIFI